MPAINSPYRVFSQKSFVTDFTAYTTKEAASAKIDELKQKHGKLLARVVERKGEFVIYFEESYFKTIFGTLPPKPAGGETPGSAATRTRPIKTAGTKSDTLASKSHKAEPTKEPIKLSGPSGSGKQSSRAPHVDKGARQIERKPKKASAPPPPEKRGPVSQPLEFYGPPPPYLKARMNKDAQKYYLAKDAEFERLSPKQVDKFIEIFNAELLKFDVNFEKERPVMGRIREIQGILNKLKLKFDDEIVVRFLAEKVQAPLEEGKFAKILQKYEGFNARIVAEAILKDIGRARRDCPLSDYALSKEIAQILLEKYPGKYKEDR